MDVSCLFPTKFATYIDSDSGHGLLLSAPNQIRPHPAAKLLVFTASSILENYISHPLSWRAWEQPQARRLQTPTVLTQSASSVSRIQAS